MHILWKEHKAVPVSYTHLDVYKRQEHTEADVIVYVLGEKSDGIMQVRDAIAMGCDRGEVIVADDLGELDIWSCARIFAEHVEPKCYDLIISGGFPTDADTVPLGLLTANILGITSISHVENICISEKAGYVDIDRRIEDRLEPVSYTHLDVYKRQICSSCYLHS